MYIVFENEMSNATFYFALTEEQMKDEKSKVLIDQAIVKEIARVATVQEMKNLPTDRKISYLNKKNEIKFA